MIKVMRRKRYNSLARAAIRSRILETRLQNADTLNGQLWGMVSHKDAELLRLRKAVRDARRICEDLSAHMGKMTQPDGVNNPVSSEALYREATQINSRAQWFLDIYRVPEDAANAETTQLPAVVLQPETYAHDSWCNTNHVAGAEQCPPPIAESGDETQSD